MTGRRDNATNDIHVDVETYVHVSPLSSPPLDIAVRLTCQKHTQDIHSSDDDVRDKKNNEDVESLSDIHGHKSRGFDSQSHLTEPRHIA